VLLPSSGPHPLPGPPSPSACELDFVPPPSQGVEAAPLDSKSRKPSVPFHLSHIPPSPPSPWPYPSHNGSPPLGPP